MKITIILSTEEFRGIQALAAQCDIAPQMVLEQFVADLTNSDRAGGSDERFLADEYMMRCNYSGPLHGHDLTEEERKYLKAVAQKSDQRTGMKITLDLSEEEYRRIRDLTDECGITPQMVLEQFVADLTHSGRTGGSDERLFAENYMMRCNYSSPLHSHYFTEEQRKHLDEIAQQSDRFCADFERYKLLARAEWRTGRAPYA